MALTYDTVLNWIDREARRAADRYGGFTLTQEALGVLTEEMRELEDAIRANNRSSIASEAMQVSAVAMRLLNQVRLGDESSRERSGCG